jgi:hypothetical protein
MSAIDKIKSITSNDVSSFVVEAWSDDEPFEIFYTPMTLADISKINKRAKTDAEIIVYTLIFKALDKDGNRLFDLGDKVYLMSSVPSDVLADIVSRMGSGTDDHEKN